MAFRGTSFCRMVDYVLSTQIIAKTKAGYLGEQAFRPLCEN